MPGLVYALDGRSPGLGWYLPFPAYRKFNSHFLSSIQLLKQQSLFLIVGWQLQPDVIADLKKSGLNFPSDFRLISQLKCPFAIGLIDGKEDSGYLNGNMLIYQYVGVCPTKNVVKVETKND